MSTVAAIEYLKSQLRAHIARFFTTTAMQSYDAVPVQWLPMRDATQVRGRTIVIPTDIPIALIPGGQHSVPFNGTSLVLWNPIPAPSGYGWTACPDGATPLWYRHASGTVMPAWNLAKNLLALLTLQEEKANDTRDRHGRFMGTMSPRDAASLLEVPAFNDAAAALVAACIGLEADGEPAFELGPRHLRPPAIVLSHDLDQLRGNDVWTQAVRIFRSIQPITRGKLPSLRHLWYVLVNILGPRRYYFDNVIGMIALERMMRCTSALYFLNGRRGRFGARSGPTLIPELAALVPAGWAIGAHYNFDTHLNRCAFDHQLQELTALTGRRITAGRAHYLRFDPRKSWAIWNAAGIEVDESLGYPDRIGYRAGIAGAFQPLDEATGQALPIFEVPLVVMESTLLKQYPEDPVGAFRRLLHHLGKVGGALTLLFHPGVFHNPEEPAAMGLYGKLLAVARDSGAVSRTADSFLNQDKP